MVTATVPGQQVKIGPTKLLINNEWVNSVSNRRFETINPTTGEVICEVSEADAPDVDKAVQAARNAFTNGQWRKISATRRGELLYLKQQEGSHCSCSQVCQVDIRPRLGNLSNYAQIQG